MFLKHQLIVMDNRLRELSLPSTRLAPGKTNYSRSGKLSRVPRWTSQYNFYDHLGSENQD